VAHAGEEAAAPPVSEGETAGAAPSQDRPLLIAGLAILMMLCLFVMIISLWVALQQRSR
jgi:hypothetical protein